MFRLRPNGTDTTDFDLNPEFQPKSPVLREAAVLVPLQFSKGMWQVLLTKRSAALPHHPGQIAFPGGKVDPTDDGALDAALREAEEEIGLPRQSVDVFGQLPSHQTVTGFIVRPFVGVVDPDFIPVPEAGEVDEVFSVPLRHFLTPNNFLIQGRMYNGVERRFFVVPFGPYYIWGATARMLRLLCDCLEGPNED